MSAYADPRERLVGDVKVLLADTEEFLLALGAESKDKIAGIRPRLEAAMRRARTQAAEVEAALEARSREGARRVGAYASAIAAARFHLPFWVAVPAGGAAACLAGMVVGVPSLRIKGLYLAISTLAAQVMTLPVIAPPLARLLRNIWTELSVVAPAVTVIGNGGMSRGGTGSNPCRASRT